MIFYLCVENVSISRIVLHYRYTGLYEDIRGQYEF